METGGIVDIPANATTCNTLAVKGNVNLESGAVLRIANGKFDEAPVSNTEYRVLNVTGTLSGTFAEILPAKPGDGLAWDTTHLYDNGIIKVVNDDDLGIRILEEGMSPLRIDYYNLSGEKVLAPADGIYIMRMVFADEKTVTRKIVR